MQLELFQDQLAATILKKFEWIKKGESFYQCPAWEMNLDEAVAHVRDMWRLTESRYGVKLSSDNVMKQLQQQCFEYLFPHLEGIEKALKINE